ncbi:MAG TPA: hypothetical protein VFM57_12450 [Thermoleophilaceae bacterium]|nr:hypothetical protein [Thermoleophilaceae bacterium]
MRLTTLAMILAGVLLLLQAAGASAATPLAGGAYAGAAYDDRTDQQASGRLLVSRSGRRIAPGTAVGAWAPCARERGRAEVGARLRLTAPAAIRPDGRFRFTERRAGTSIVARGRFRRRWAARLVVSVRKRPPNPRDRRRPGFCRAGPTVVQLEHVGLVPFRDCRTHPARTLALSAEGRIFQHRTYGDFDTRVYGCLFSTDTRVFLGGLSASGDQSVGELFRLGGPYAGWVSIGCAASCGRSVVVTDLRNGARFRRSPSDGAVADLVLSSAGTAAFIAAGRFLGAPTEVRVIEPTIVTCLPAPYSVCWNSTRLLDSGNIDPTSLTLADGTLSWMKDGVLRTAPLE